MLRDARRGRVELSEMLGSNPQGIQLAATHLGGDSFMNHYKDPY